MREKRILLNNCGKMDSMDISSYEANGGFKSLKKAKKQTPDSIINEIKKAGLRGRGGAGFSCGAKWELAAKAKGGQKYLICNADEGEVGTFKDRYIIENDPFGLIEGMAIAAYAIGSSKAFIYLRDEYRYLLKKLENAIDQAMQKKYLSDLKIEIQLGAGAYICGEESALMNSIEGKRGESRVRPPFPPTSGLFGKPTIINNVETFLNVPIIVDKGSSWYSKLGKGKSKGTKIFCVSGDVEKPGVYEMELGCKLKDLIVDLAGAKDVKFVQVGGSTGGIIPASMLETPLTYETVIGSGAIMVFNNSRDVIDIVCRTLNFLNEESCGFCTPCREGTEVMVEIYNRLIEGDGKSEDLKILEELSKVMIDSSMCGLGQTVAVPILDTLKYYRSEYENRIERSIFLRTLMNAEQM